MNYPQQCPIIYENPNGNLAASGYYRSSTTQELANMMPNWMHLRQNNRSVGQQFISPAALELKRLETTLNDCMKSKYISTAPLDEIDVLYRAYIPSNVDLTDASASGIRCVAAPSGCSPSGISQIWLKEVSDLKEFYYDVLPTRMEVYSSGTYASSVDGRSWNTKPSGIYDSEEKHVDIWKKKHDISWCYDSIGGLYNYGRVLKQDVETLEDYEVYTAPGTGIILDMDFYRGMLWSVHKHLSSYYLSLASTKTQQPNKTLLDTLAIFDISDAFDLEPSGIMVIDDGTVNICDTNKTRIFTVYPRYDYFITDKNNRYVYMREDYRDSGVFISNT